MENQTTPRLVCYKDPVTGERLTVPESEAPTPFLASAAVEAIPAPAAAPKTHQAPRPASGPQAFNAHGENAVMTRSYYRGQSGINTYSNTVQYAGATWFIEELSGADFNEFKAQLKALSFDIKNQQKAMTAQEVDPNQDASDALEDGAEWIEITRRKTAIHREVIEKTVRGCTDPHLATVAGRDCLYQNSVEELASLIISASLLGKDGSDFLAE